MFKRINKKMAKELLGTGLVWHDCSPYNVIRSSKGRDLYAIADPEYTWPRVMDWDSSKFSYMYFLYLED